MAETQQLHHLRLRPFCQPTPGFAHLILEGQRAGSGKFHWPSDPEPAIGCGMQRLRSQPAVAQDAIARLSGGDPFRRRKAQQLEGGNSVRGGAGHLLHLLTVIEGKDPQAVMLAMTRR